MVKLLTCGLTILLVAGGAAESERENVISHQLCASKHVNIIRNLEGDYPPCGLIGLGDYRGAIVDDYGLETVQEYMYYIRANTEQSMGPGGRHGSEPGENSVLPVTGIIVLWFRTIGILVFIFLVFIFLVFIILFFFSITNFGAIFHKINIEVLR
ncbi:hypothetical protein PC9H_004297 [Pleurotus ostreatus]|uniref:Uncharacterized protein n=1 Tax=Pleurotus ostreatus TaxID=5322 RepID=A0A8H7A008_PLEOS|nr:uncharacterized protein PC9H_004297 [Pleurotus ostreatus]KAF7437458.1 hypothetical protein PC9H_004297 [Pleurotus ostreatus]